MAKAKPKLNAKAESKTVRTTKAKLAPDLPGERTKEADLAVKLNYNIQRLHDCVRVYNDKLGSMSSANTMLLNSTDNYKKADIETFIAKLDIESKAGLAAAVEAYREIKKLLA